MDALKEHTIVCGFGRNGRQAVNRLRRHHYPYVVIEQNANMISTHEQDIIFLKVTRFLMQVLRRFILKRLSI